MKINIFGKKENENKRHYYATMAYVTKVPNSDNIELNFENGISGCDQVIISKETALDLLSQIKDKTS